MKISSILGLNARSQLYSYKYNNTKGRKICNSKILTERFLKKVNVPVPEIYKVFRRPQDVLNFNWDSLSSSFALKPSRGLGGQGIIVIKKRANPPTLGWITTQRTTVSINDLKLHTLDILEGAYSLGNEPDVAFIQEYVGRHNAFRKYAFRGTPDIRVIVFNKVPIMAMLRLPTKNSDGKANLHQGAIGVGIDIPTGITTKAILNSEFIKYKPNSTRKLNGIKIPLWTSILKTAINAQITSGMGYLGADIVLHPEKGPMVLEMNSQPGLQIQLCNNAGLRKRLERIEDLEVRDADHGVNIAKALFISAFSSKVKNAEGAVTVKTTEKVQVYKYNSKNKLEVLAKVDTGAYRTSIDKTLAKDLGLLNEGNILWKDRYAYRSAVGRQSRQVISIKYILGGKKIISSASVADRSKMKTMLLVGRRDLVGFMVSPQD